MVKNLRAVTEIRMFIEWIRIDSELEGVLL